MTGRITGAPFAGASRFPDEARPGHEYGSPNLTAAGAGPVASWTEDQFVERFRRGRVLRSSPIHCQQVARIQEDDVRAVYRYLRSLGEAPRVAAGAPDGG